MNTNLTEPLAGMPLLRALVAAMHHLQRRWSSTKSFYHFRNDDFARSSAILNLLIDEEIMLEAQRRSDAGKLSVRELNDMIFDELFPLSPEEEEEDDHVR